MTWLNIDYARQVFSDTPLRDDWAFIDQLRTYVSDEAGLSHLLKPHNGHPSLIGRLAFLLSFHFQGLNLQTIRWFALAISFGTATVVTIATTLILIRRPEAPGFAQPGFMLAVPLIVVLCTSLGQWEIFTLAMGVGNAAVNLFAFSAIFGWYFWLKGRRPVWLLVSLGCAVLACVSMGQGMLVWGVLAAMTSLHRDRKRLLPLAALLATTFLASFALLLSISDKTRETLPPAGLYRLLAEAIGLLGVPIFGHIGNTVIIPVTTAFGVAVAIFAVLALLRFARAPASLRDAMLPFLGCMGFGGAAMMLIVISRQHFPLDAILASRYVPILAPLPIGIAGLLGVGAPCRSAGAQLLIAFFAVAAVGLGVTNQQEYAMANARADFFRRINAQILHQFEDMERAEAAATPLSEEETSLLRQTKFLRQRGLSVFRGQQPGNMGSEAR